MATNSTEKYSILEGFQDAMRDLPTGDIKVVARGFLAKIEKELETEPMAMIYQAMLMGAGLNTLTPDRLGHGLSYFAKLMTWKAISAAEPAFASGARKALPPEVSGDSKVSGQEARHAS